MIRFAYVMVTYFSVIGVAISAVGPTPITLIWNASASVPVGLYTVHPAETLQVGDLVAVMMPEPTETLMVERGYIARGVPLLKRVSAMSGQQVCRTGRDIMIDGRFAAAALERDRMGRELPVWQGCRTIADGEIFLMNSGVRDSLDGRYFGVMAVTSIIGKAMPLFTDEHHGGRFIWRATQTPGRE